MIEVRDLTFRYSSNLPLVLKGISLSIPMGSLTCIMGSNGSGKSTLARGLNGLLTPTTGTVIADGLNTQNPAARHEIRRKVGLVFQDPNLQMTSVTVERELAFGLENLRTDWEEMHSRVEEYLGLFGFKARRDDPPSSLSAGERQQLAIASVMILTPSYLVLDEATSLLAARTRSLILNMVSTLRQRHHVAVILITQYPSEALLGERLIVIHEGKIMFDDQPERVFQHADVLVRMGVPVPLRERLRVMR